MQVRFFIGSAAQVVAYAVQAHRRSFDSGFKTGVFVYVTLSRVAKINNL